MNSDAIGYVVAALVTGLFGVLVVWIQIRSNRTTRAAVTDVHDEVRTNHGARQGQRIEDLGVDVAWIRGQMVTKADLEEHARADLAFQKRVEPFLREK